ncbi:hypothetical protein ACLI1A_10335 [Flavobacterium sp. RHBU_3]|uniref:hypothetical protein n=1 Tax=Flavobacterium sp. RHBU_3 TaxID=3391184 RepID=UPI00398508C9
MIKWKKVGEHIPNNEGKDWPGQPCTPYVSCLVWICNPDFSKGGVFAAVRWDRDNACWFEPDLARTILAWGDHLKITHFIEHIEAPTDENN